MDKPKKLTKRDFFDVYGISLILKETRDSKTVQYLIFLLESIVKIYLDISHYAVLAELRYFKRGACKVDREDISQENISLLKKLGIKNWKVGRKTLTIKEAEFLFQMGDWECHYGGQQWGIICHAVQKLESLLPITEQNIKKVISAIDYLNDLEHNNALYLDQYSTFHLFDALEEKAGCSESELIVKCSKDIRDIYCEV